MTSHSDAEILEGENFLLMSKRYHEEARGVRHKLLTFVYGAESELKEVRFVRKQQQIGYQ
jgi:hypothetical protein